MPINPDDYRKFLADENLTPEREDAFIHSMSHVLGGIIDRRMHALERMRHQSRTALIHSNQEQNGLTSDKAQSNKEET